ncbi:MAG: RNA polymerase sigma factor [Planctomycetaceae bacterium]
MAATILTLMAEKQQDADDSRTSDADFLRDAYEEHAPWLRTVVRHRLGEPQAVDDVMQEVAVAVFRQTAPIRDPDRIAPWLYRIAVRQTLMYRRSAGRRRKLRNNYAGEVHAVGQDTEATEPLRWLMHEERENNVRQAIDGLPELDREILMLKYTENWNYQQLADHLGVSLHTVEYRLLRARKRLRRELTRLDVAGVNP